MSDFRHTRRFLGRGFSAGMAVIVLALATVWTPRPSTSGAAPPGPDPTFNCPSAQCPYSAPSADEQGFAADVLARMTIERSQSQRDFTYQGAKVNLGALPVDVIAQQTAQAMAEYDASVGWEYDYGGSLPSPDEGGAGNAGMVATSANADDAFMMSATHAGNVLSPHAGVGIGVACNANGAAFVVEIFSDGTTNEEALDYAQEAQAELAQNNEYVASGGAVTSVTDVTVDGTYTFPSQDVFPEYPIAAASNYATGVNWSCSGPTYAPGSVPVSPLPGPVVGIASSADGKGYALVNAAGAISVHGDATFHGGANGLTLSEPIVHMQETSDGGGYWLVAGDGGVFNYGDARNSGSLPALGLHVSNIVGLVPTDDGGGYWLAGSDGGIFAFGDADFVGSLPGLGVHVENIVGIVPTPDDKGYWMVGSDGGVFAFGDAEFVGSLPALGVHVDNIVGIIPTSNDRGYWLVGSDGGVFAFGNAGYVGSLPGLGVHVDNIVGIASPPGGSGYWLVGSDGGVFALGVPFYGSD
jgi:hypothetical protein